MATKKKKSNAKAWEIGGAVTAAAIAAAAGAYLLSDRKTKAKAKKWVMDARKEVVRHAKAAKKLSEKEYATMVDQAIKRYGSVNKMTTADIIAAGQELKGQWKKIHAEAMKMSKKRKPAHKVKAKAKAKTRVAKKKARA
jgi:hypothetical protein